jgi:hypothetical protein
MNIIKEQRDTIIRENDTGQDELIQILESDGISKQSTELIIRQPLSGNIDLSVLREYGYTYIKTIEFVEGEITGLQNVPDDLTSLSCSQQLLIELENLPPSLESLNIQNNYLKTLDLDRCKKLKVLNIINNHVNKIENMPPSLEELYCDNNDFKILDLQTVQQLRVLHISNNKAVIIENLPPSLVDFKSENNPMVELEYSNGADSSESEDESKPTKKKHTTVQRVNYIEALYEYFKLKSAYEERLKQQKKTAYAKGDGKRKVAKRLVSEVKAKCINCSRPVGTIFTSDNARYTAICGDKKNPCNLKIILFNAITKTNEYWLNYDRELLDDSKEEIIEQKMDTLFDYMSEEESVKQFKHKLADYNKAASEYRATEDRYNELYHDPNRIELIHKKQELVYELIATIRKMMGEYEKTGNAEILRTAVGIQVKELEPEIHNLRMLKYEIMEMYNKEGSYVLFQRDVSLAKTDYNIGEPASIIHYEKNA